MLLGEEIFVCGGQADKEVINFAESFSTDLQMWEPISSRMFHPRVGLGELPVYRDCSPLSKIYIFIVIMMMLLS